MEVRAKTRALLEELARKGVRLVAVTKGVPPEKANEAIDAGVEAIGENRVQEAATKISLLKPCEKHFVGVLQSNKVGKAVALFDVIESIDSLELLRKVNNAALSQGKKITVFLEINIGEERQKSGFPPDEEEIFRVIEEGKKLAGVRVTGLMAIGPNVSGAELRPYFRKMKRLFDSLNERGARLEALSMGMSASYREAIAEGANLVRIGTAIFG